MILFEHKTHSGKTIKLVMRDSIIYLEVLGDAIYSQPLTSTKPKLHIDRGIGLVVNWLDDGFTKRHTTDYLWSLSDQIAITLSSSAYEAITNMLKGILHFMRNKSVDSENVSHIRFPDENNILRTALLGYDPIIVEYPVLCDNYALVFKTKLRVHEGITNYDVNVLGWDTKDRVLDGFSAMLYDNKAVYDLEGVALFIRECMIYWQNLIGGVQNIRHLPYNVVTNYQRTKVYNSSGDFLFASAQSNSYIIQEICALIVEDIKLQRDSLIRRGVYNVSW